MRRRLQARGIIGLAVIALTGCETKTAEQASVRKIPSPAVAKPVPLVPVHVDQLLASPRGRAPIDGMRVARLKAKFVGPDGMLDPRFSSLEVEYGSAARAGQDDPTRPTGAPVIATQRQACPVFRWLKGKWTSISPQHCAEVVQLRCTIPEIWARAIAKGAPRDAVAEVSVDATQPHQPTSWIVMIRDPVRNVDFREEFSDTCTPLVEAVDPDLPGDEPVPAKVDRTMVRNLLGAVRPRVTACATSRQRGTTVTVSFKVAPDGTINELALRTAPTFTFAIEHCLKGVIEAIRFPRTREGGSVSYPFKL